MQVQAASRTSNASPSLQPILLSDEIIPAVRGEFYSYSATFTPDRPLYCMMKCKANKDRPLVTAQQVAGEIDLVFSFRCVVFLCSPHSYWSARLLCGLVRNLGTLEKTSILSTRITENAFYELHRQKDASALVQITSTATPDPNEYVPLSVGTIHAVRTASGKHGLILVKDISFSAITIDACHILL